MRRTEGSALVVSLLLLAIVALLGISGASGARVELRLAQNLQFRENASTAAHAGLESAISQIVTATRPASVPATVSGDLPEAGTRYEAGIRFLGLELGLPQVAGTPLAAAHFEITSTGHSLRGAIDVQRAFVMRVVAIETPAEGRDCEPLAIAVPCANEGDFRRLSWQRLPRS